MSYKFGAHGRNKLINFNEVVHLCRNVSSRVVHFHRNTNVKWYTLTGMSGTLWSGLGGTLCIGLGGTLCPEWVVHYGPE